jgi:hypothetical protein
MTSDAVGFDWQEFDEMGEVKGDGFAELQLNGIIEGEFAYDNGDQSTLRARRW